MYEEIIRELMKWDIVIMVFWVLLFLILPIFIYSYIAYKEKKKKRKKKKKWNSFQESDEQKALAGVIFGILIFCVTFAMGLYDYLSLREDMVTENYVTYTGVFECYESGSRSSRQEYVSWTDPQGNRMKIRYSHHIDSFHANEQSLESGNYTGTIVYSPTGERLLWWDAVPIEK